MRQMGIRELRDNLTTAIRSVRQGETIEVTHDGEPVAMITPVTGGRLERLIAQGASRPEPLVRPIRPLPSTTGITASEALEDDRSVDR